jgi:hypothetical protein
MDKLDKKGKGIVLMHDIHKNTAKALPLLLTALKDKGYKIVHLTAKAPLETLPEFDALIEKDTKGLPQAGAERPTSSVVRTISGDGPVEEAPPVEAAPAGKQSQATPPPAAPAAPAAAAPVITEPVKSAAGEPPAAAHEKPASPVSTVGEPGTTASITPNSSTGADPNGESAPSKSYVEQAKEMWETWFGK